MRIRAAAVALVLQLPGASAQAAESLFAQLVEASAQPDQRALIEILSRQTINTDVPAYDTDGWTISEQPRLNVPAEEIAARLKGCAVAAWLDVGSDLGDPFVKWECPTKRIPGKKCEFDGYRATLSDRHPPFGLYIKVAPTWDHVRCGPRVVAPPPPPAPLPKKDGN